MKLGVSVYLAQPFAEQEAYLRKAWANGFNVLFTSLHIPEDDVSVYAERLQQVGAFAKQNGMELVCDVSPQSMEHLNKTWEQAADLTDWGVTGLRMDYGVPPQTVARIAAKMEVVLNASTLHEEEAFALIKAGVAANQVEAWHNFYPRPETGLGRVDFQEMNDRLRKLGFPVMAFIPGDERRGPLYQGLPTLEDHRGGSPFAAFLDLYKEEGIQKILVGDRTLSEASFTQFRWFTEADTVLLRARATGDITNIEQMHCNRKDAARDVLRSEFSRALAANRKRDILPAQTVERPIGTITIDNNRYGRYKGEIQVTKCDLAADEKVNVLGRVIQEDIPLIQHIKGGQKWALDWI